MVRDTIINMPVVDQHRDTKNVEWEQRTCGVCSLKMVLVLRENRLENLEIMEMVNGALGYGGYLDNVGWSHASLVRLAGGLGVKMEYKKIFSKTPSEKKKDLLFLNKNLEAGKPVIVSIFHELNPEKGGHLVVVCGARRNNGKIIGYHIQDPDSRFRGNNYLLTNQEFMSGWRGGMIWLID